MRDTDLFVEAIRKVARSVFRQMQPCDVMYGSVISTDPLKVRIMDGETISPPMLRALNSADPDVDDVVALLKKQGGAEFILLGVMDQ